jgi:hypothetical protein
MKHLFTTYELPQHWASALINGDDSGLDEDDIERLNEFERDMVKEYGKCWCVDVEEEGYFKTYHDARKYGVLACNVAIFTFDTSPDETL